MNSHHSKTLLLTLVSAMVGFFLSLPFRLYLSSTLSETAPPIGWVTFEYVYPAQNYNSTVAQCTQF